MPWPGPNSNTLVADLCRRAAIPVELPASAIGQDWPTLVPYVFDVRPSTTRTGVQLDLFGVVGLQLGLREGIEVHFLGAELGLDLWPPALKLPFLDRIGFAEGQGVERTGDVGAWIQAHRRDHDPSFKELTSVPSRYSRQIGKSSHVAQVFNA